MNKFAEATGQTTIPLQRHDPGIERAQAERLQRLRESRDAESVEKMLRDVRKAAQGTENVMPAFIAAVDAGATLGEICNVLRDVFGVYRAREVVA